MTDNACATLSGALAIIGPLLIWAGTGSILAALGAFCVTVSALLPWYNVIEVAVNEHSEVTGLTHATRTESEDGRRKRP